MMLSLHILAQLQYVLLGFQQTTALVMFCFLAYFLIFLFLCLKTSRNAMFQICLCLLYG